MSCIAAEEISNPDPQSCSFRARLCIFWILFSKLRMAESPFWILVSNCSTVVMKPLRSISRLSPIVTSSFFTPIPPLSSLSIDRLNFCTSTTSSNVVDANERSEDNSPQTAGEFFKTASSKFTDRYLPYTTSWGKLTSFSSNSLGNSKFPELLPRLKASLSWRGISLGPPEPKTRSVVEFRVNFPGDFRERSSPGKLLGSPSRDRKFRGKSCWDWEFFRANSDDAEFTCELDGEFEFRTRR
mmetsp:Transcript_6986/g.13736  ORF Transcript_6986/g.13736 Transcript_6986/m.13736 type:complete len:241 (-) Transcript_6986:258-980(-)